MKSYENYFLTDSKIHCGLVIIHAELRLAPNVLTVREFDGAMTWVVLISYSSDDPAIRVVFGSVLMASVS